MRKLSCFFLAFVLMIGLFPGSVSAYTIDGKAVYEYADGSVWVDDFYYGWEKYPAIRYSNSGNGVYFSFDLSNDVYGLRNFGMQGNISCFIYACKEKNIGSEVYARASGTYEDGKGSMTISLASYREEEIYHLNIALNSMPAYSVEFIVKDENVYFNRMNRDYMAVPYNTKENCDAYIKLVEELNGYGAYNYIKDYNESYLFLNDVNSHAKAKEIAANCYTDYEKVNTISKWIYYNIVYDASSLIDENRKWNADAVLEQRNGACMEHAILLRAMLNAVNIPCVYVSSKIGNHAWNMAYVDHHWVWIDCTNASMSDNAFSLYEIYTDAEIYNRYKDSKIQNSDDTGQKDNSNDDKNKENESICEMHQWDEGNVILEPTCLIEGTIQYLCTKCYDIKIVTLPMKAHDYGPWKTIVLADTQNEGMEQRECKYCGNVEKRVIPVVVKRDNAAKKNLTTTKKISGIAKKYRLKIGQTMVLKPVIKPVASIDKITYKSSRPKVVAVNKKGKVTAIKKGTAAITIKSGKKKIQCKIIVKS